MFISRASRHDKGDIKALLDAHGWRDANLDRGVVFFAREGPVTGCVQLVEVAPQKVVVDNVLVREEYRGQGTGRRLMQTAMNSRGGTLYLCCHPEVLGFYGGLGFDELSFEDLPKEAQAHFRAEGAWPTEEGHEHRFMTAR